MPQIKIEQIAFGTGKPQALMQLFSTLLGLDEWSHDEVEAEGKVFGADGSNKAQLHFNYQQGVELEVLKYDDGPNWHESRDSECYDGAPFLSHIGMHVTEEQLSKVRVGMHNAGIGVAQEVFTVSHTNPAIAGKRKYNYVIFDTKNHFGFDLKLIVRHDISHEDENTIDCQCKDEHGNPLNECWECPR